MNPGIFQIIFTYTKSFCNYGICLLTLIMFIQLPSGWLYSLPILNPILFFNWKCLAALLISCMSYEIFSYSHVVHFTQVLSHLSHNALDEYPAVPHYSRYIMVLYNMILHTAKQLRRYNFSPTSNSQKMPILCPDRWAIGVLHEVITMAS